MANFILFKAIMAVITKLKLMRNSLGIQSYNKILMVSWRSIMLIAGGIIVNIVIFI